MSWGQELARQQGLESSTLSLASDLVMLNSRTQETEGAGKVVTRDGSSGPAN